MRHRAFVYGAPIVGTLVISLDFASVNLALPALEAQYGLDRASLQWVINGYVLMWQLSGAALILAVSTAIFSAVSARDLQGSLAHDGIVSSPINVRRSKKSLPAPETSMRFRFGRRGEVKDLAGDR
jgi:hypothetical protein